MSKEVEQNLSVQEPLTKGAESVLEGISQSLSKSMFTGHDTSVDGRDGASALRVENLANQVRMLTFTQDDFTIYRDINKQSIDSTVHQYNLLTQHGRVGHSRFVREEGIAEVNTPRIKRKYVNLKFISDTKQQTIASQIVRNVASPEQIQTEDALIVIAKTIEWALFYGDASLTGEENREGREFDGLAKLIDQNTNILDIRGRSLSEADINHAGVIIGKGYGKATDAYMPIGVHADFINETLLRRQVVVQPAPSGAEGMATGVNISSMYTTRGLVKLHGSTIMENDNVLLEDELPHEKAPVPAQDVTASIAVNDKSKFLEDDAITQSYKVVVFGDGYPSQPTEEIAVVLDKAGQSVTLDIKLNVMTQSAPELVAIYRKGHETGHYFLIDRVPASPDEDGIIKYVDNNETLPETADVFVGENTPQVVALLELLPMVKIPLAQMQAMHTFTVLWYGALALYAPKKWVRIKNVRYIPVVADDTRH